MGEFWLKQFGAHRGAVIGTITQRHTVQNANLNFSVAMSGDGNESPKTPRSQDEEMTDLRERMQLLQKELSDQKSFYDAHVERLTRENSQLKQQYEVIATGRRSLRVNRRTDGIVRRLDFGAGEGTSKGDELWTHVTRHQC